MVEAKRGDGVGTTTLHVRALNIVPISRYVSKIIAIRLYGTTLKKKKLAGKTIYIYIDFFTYRRFVSGS